VTGELLAALVLGAGVYLAATALPFGEARQSLDERLRQFDVDARLAERRTATWVSRPLVPWAPLDAVVRPLLEDLAGPLRGAVGGQGAYGAELERRLRLVRPGTDPRWFVARQLLVGGLAGVAALALLLAVGVPVALGLILAALAGLASFSAPQIWLRAKVIERRDRIVAELPALCRLLSMALDAGLTLDRALVMVAMRSAGPLGRALHAANEEVVGDRRLKDALSDLARRERIAALDAFVSLLGVADREGLELIPSLEAMANSLNDRRAARTIEAAEKGSIKMLAPVAFVMFPVALVVALAPLLDTVLQLVGRS
jgi:Flp pilus assembly protein TadB